MSTVDFSKMTPAQILEFAKKMQEENDRMKEEKALRVSFKVSVKGAISVYGLGRLPLTLHPSQWDALLASSPTLIKFIDANRTNCAKQSETYENIQTEGKAKGLKDAKLDAYVIEMMIRERNPYASETALRNAQQRAG